MLTYNEFVDSIKHKVCLEYRKEQTKDCNVKNSSKDVGYLILEHSYETSYVRGGSCWDTGESDPHYSGYNEITEEDRQFENLKELLNIVAPNISLKQFEQLQSLVKEDSIFDQEYYGNSSTRTVLTVKLEDIYLKLKEWGYISN